MAESTGGVGRVAFRLFALIVVAAAGMGGWMAYDWLLAEPETGADAAEAATPFDQERIALDDGLLGDDPLAEDPPVGDPLASDPTGATGAASPPWPADFVPATTTWGSFVTSYQPPGEVVVRQQMAFDGLSKQTQMTLFDSDGVETAVIEVRGIEAWRDDGEGFQLAEEVNGGFAAGAAHADVVPATFDDLLPPVTWPYVSLAGDGSDAEPPGVRRLVFTVDAGAFAAADPMGLAEWREDVPAIVDDPVETWVIDVDADGHIVRRNHDPDDLTVRHSELAQAIIFTSPLAG